MNDMYELLQEAEVLVAEKFNDDPRQLDASWQTFVTEKIEELCPPFMTDLLVLAEAVWNDEPELKGSTPCQMVQAAVCERLSTAAWDKLWELREAAGIPASGPVPAVLYRCGSEPGAGCQQRWYANVDMLGALETNDAEDGEVGRCPDCGEYVYPDGAAGETT